MPFLTKTVFGLFAILVPILLLNMLIAMMANTYQQISSRAEKEWRRQVTGRSNRAGLRVMVTSLIQSEDYSDKCLILGRWFT